jgi:3-oxoadipate enol-lactonase
MPIVELDGVRLRYEISGAAQGDVVVLVNSLGADLHMWDKVLPAIERDWRVVRYDTRGHGESGVPPRPYTMAQLGADLVGLLDRLAIGRAHVCGLSLGGMVGMWMGIHQPERVDRLIFANTAARIGTHAGWEERIAAVRDTGMVPLARATLSRWFTERYREAHPQEMDEIRAMVERTPVEGYMGCCEVLRDTDLSGDVARIEATCLVIAGSSDPATPAVDGRALHAALRKSAYVELEASHLSAWERADAFAGAVLAFLHHTSS